MPNWRYASIAAPLRTTKPWVATTRGYVDHEVVTIAFEVVLMEVLGEELVQLFATAFHIAGA